MQTYFEATAQHRKLGDIGRAMMDWSEQYGKHHGLRDVTDAGLTTLNTMSLVGEMLTHYGAPYGTTQRDFTPEYRELITNFLNKTVDIERR